MAAADTVSRVRHDGGEKPCLSHPRGQSRPRQPSHLDRSCGRRDRPDRPGPGRGPPGAPGSARPPGSSGPAAGRAARRTGAGRAARVWAARGAAAAPGRRAHRRRGRSRCCGRRRLLGLLGLRRRLRGHPGRRGWCRRRGRLPVVGPPRPASPGRVSVRRRPVVGRPGQGSRRRVAGSNRVAGRPRRHRGLTPPGRRSRAAHRLGVAHRLDVARCG